jgi:major intracellular serine protease
MKKNDCALLPFFREDIYGLSPDNAQILGWEITKFNIPDYWQKTQGENVKIAVIDTGCDIDHPDLQNNLLQGINLINKKRDPIDDNGHGTHVCGTIAAENNGLGIVGISPKSKILPIKALNGDGSGNNKIIAEGIIYAVDNKCDFITMSLGSPNSSLDLYNSIKYAVQKGVVVFCAAGNSGQNSPIMYPAKYEETIAIGSIDRFLNRSQFTCTGNELDFLAPGQDILGCVPDNRYALMSGTSMANPFAVGCASLALSLYKKSKTMNLKNKSDYIKLFSKQCTHLKDKRYALKKQYEGYGIINPSI